MSPQTQAATTEFATVIAELIASGQFVMPTATDDPVIGYQDLDVDVDPADLKFGVTPGTEAVTQSEALREFADLDVDEQNSYAEAMFAAGLGDGLDIETIDEIYDPFNISYMLQRALGRAEESLKIGRQQLPSELYGGQEATSLRDALAMFDEKKPSVTLYDPATLRETAQTYFQDELGRDATMQELKSFTAGIHAAQNRGDKGAALGIASRAREFAREADPDRAAGMNYSQAAGRAMKALGMN